MLIEVKEKNKMGTNYYLRERYCKHCGRYDKLHIGKSSIGWRFLFSSELGKSYKDVMKVVEKHKGDIVDEYNKTIFLSHLKELIEEKQNSGKHNSDATHYMDKDGYDFSDNDFR